jgi:hypothetical protein
VILKIAILTFHDGSLEGICELETPAVIEAINTGGKHRSTCPRQPPGILEFAVKDDSEQGLKKSLGWYGLAT